MSEHVTDELPRLLTGDATRDETLAAAAHLRDCPECREELISAVIAHASLASAHRFAPELLARDDTSAPDEAESRPLPDLSAMFEQVRSETAAHPRRRHRRRLIAGAAAAAVVLAGGGITLAETLGSSGHGTPSAKTITLEPVGANHARAEATVSGGTMRIDASALPNLDPSHHYEVWLAAAAGQPRAVGFIGADHTASLPVPRSVMTLYSSVAISIQRSDQAAFSGIMVASGSYG
jgi:anti-sigma-K factor RskA